jgi:hypothetical protein
MSASGQKLSASGVGFMSTRPFQVKMVVVVLGAFFVTIGQLDVCSGVCYTAFDLLRKSPGA